VLSRLVPRPWALVVLFVLFSTPFARSAAGPGPFDTVWPELAADVALPRWERARTALVEDGRRLEACLADVAACEGPARAGWRDLVRSLEDRPRRVQLDAVNRFVNGVPYATDARAHGRRDFWAGPWSFLADRGDCEDYAIAKYATLRKLGVPVHDLRILVVEDRWRGLAHAVLAVRVGARVWLLDNQSDELIDASKDRRYAPYYAVNETDRWLFRLPVTATAAR